MFAGDSIMRDAMPYIGDELLTRHSAPIPIYNAIGGAPLQAINYFCGRAAAINRLAIPDKVFISLGINDARHKVTPDDFKHHIETAMSCIDHRTDVYWILPHTTTDLSRKIKNAAKRWENLTALKFSPEPGYLKPDGIHLTKRGNEALTDLVADYFY